MRASGLWTTKKGIEIVNTLLFWMLIMVIFELALL